MIPAMTTGMMHFMMSSGRITDMAAMPTPDLAVPYAAPRAEEEYMYYTMYRVMRHAIPGN